MTKYRIIDEKTRTIEHNVVVKDSNVLLRYSNSPYWTDLVAGKKAAILKNDGNGIDILMKNLKIRLDYSQFIYLKHLMDLHFMNSTGYGSYEIEEVQKCACSCSCGNKND